MAVLRGATCGTSNPNPNPNPSPALDHRATLMAALTLLNVIETGLDGENNVDTSVPPADSDDESVAEEVARSLRDAKCAALLGLWRPVRPTRVQKLRGLLKGIKKGLTVSKSSACGATSEGRDLSDTDRDPILCTESKLLFFWTKHLKQEGKWSLMTDRVSGRDSAPGKDTTTAAATAGATGAVDMKGVPILHRPFSKSLQTGPDSDDEGDSDDDSDLESFMDEGGVPGGSIFQSVLPAVLTVLKKPTEHPLTTLQLMIGCLWHQAKTQYNLSSLQRPDAAAVITTSSGGGGGNRCGDEDDDGTDDGKYIGVMEASHGSGVSGEPGHQSPPSPSQASSVSTNTSMVMLTQAVSSSLESGLRGKISRVKGAGCSVERMPFPSPELKAWLAILRSVIAGVCFSLLDRIESGEVRAENVVALFQDEIRRLSGSDATAASHVGASTAPSPRRAPGAAWTAQSPDSVGSSSTLGRSPMSATSVTAASFETPVGPNSMGAVLKALLKDSLMLLPIIPSVNVRAGLENSLPVSKTEAIRKEIQVFLLYRTALLGIESIISKHEALMNKSKDNKNKKSKKSKGAGDEDRGGDADSSRWSDLDVASSSVNSACSLSATSLVHPCLDSLLDGADGGAVGCLRQTRALPTRNETNTASSSSSSSSTPSSASSGVLREFDRVVLEGRDVVRCNVLEPHPNEGNSNLQLMLVMKNRYGYDLKTYGKASPAMTVDPPTVQTPPGMGTTSISSLQAELQKQSGAASNARLPSVALQIKTLFMLDDAYLIVLKVAVSTASGGNKGDGPSRMPQEAFVHVAAPLHCVEVSIDQRDRRVLKVLVKSSDPQTNMQRLGRGGGGIGGGGSVSSGGANTGRGRLSSRGDGSGFSPKVSPNGLHGAALSFDGTRSVSSVGSDIEYVPRNQPSVPALLHPRTQPQLWTMSVQFESDGLCVQAVHHIERRRARLKQARCSFLKGLFHAWTDHTAHAPEQRFLCGWKSGASD